MMTVGKQLLQALKKMPRRLKKRRRRSLLEVCFRPGPSKIEKKETRYVLSAVGQEDEYSWSILWTLRIRRLPDERSYVIRDVLAFADPSGKKATLQLAKVTMNPFLT